MKKTLLIATILFATLNASASYDPKMMYVKTNQTAVARTASLEFIDHLETEFPKGNFVQFCRTFGKIEQAVDTLNRIFEVSPEVFKNPDEELTAIVQISSYLSFFKSYCQEDSQRASTAEINRLKDHRKTIDGLLRKLTGPVDFPRQ